MQTKPNLLAASVHFALFAGVLGGSAVTSDVAMAQDAEKTTELKGVTVTGTRIRRVDSETSSPVFQIDKQTIERSGAVTIGEFIRDIPSMAGAATTTQVNNGGGTGAATISLRGLGDERTLILLNGRRVAYNDVNSLPLAVVESVEILKDGASALYGSDAIGGVVNFLTRKDYEGSEFNYNYGITSEDDGQRQGASATMGSSSERGSFLVSVNYNKQEEVSAADRAYSAVALSLYSGEVYPGGSSRIPNGRYVVPRTTAAANGINLANCGSAANVPLTRIEGRPGTAWSDFRCYTGADVYNYQAVGNVQITPQERGGIFATFNYDLTDNLEWYNELVTQKTKSAGIIAPLPFDGRAAFDDVVFSRQSVYNPFGVDITDGRIRLSRIGNRTFAYETEFSQLSSGMKGVFGDSSWQWDIGITYGKLNQDALSTGYLFTPALRAALGPSFRDAGGVARCGTPTAVIAGCVPVDFFGAPPDPTTAAGRRQLEALKAISPDATYVTDSSLRSVQGVVDGSIFEMPSGSDAAMVVGFDYRVEDLDFKPSYLTTYDADGKCLVQSEACASPVSGEVKAKEVYLEAFFPIVADAPFAKRLNLTYGARHSQYDNSGVSLGTPVSTSFSSTNQKIGLEWKPMDDLFVRATYAQVFRAPTINDLYGGNFSSADGFSDPCNGYRGGGNPACANVPTNGSFSQTDTQLPAVKGGNPLLKPEEGDSITWGVLYSPSWLEGFDTTVDVWRYKLDDAIGTFGTQNILNACFSAGVACNLFSRDASGEIFTLLDINANIGRITTDGVDIGFRYGMNTGFGDWKVSLDNTYVAEFDVKGVFSALDQDNAGTFLSTSNGGLGNYSRWRSLGRLGWEMGSWNAEWTSRYVHGFKVGSDRTDRTCADLAGHGFAPSCVIERGAQTYHNFQAGYNLEQWKTQIQLGINNAFNKQPPILYQNNTLNGNTDERTFDTIGRFFWTSITVKL